MPLLRMLERMASHLLRLRRFFIMLDTKPLLLETDFPPLYRDELNTLQVNLGYLCNLTCVHCHVNAGPTRKEIMSLEVVDLIIQALKKLNISTLDLTGEHQK